MSKMGPGIDKHRLSLLMSRGIIDSEGMCVILFDIMPLQIIQEKGDSTGTSAPGHVLVFMFQGVSKRGSHILAHYFIEGSIEPMLLAETIKEVVHAVMKTLYTVLAVVCNHSDLNVTTMDILSHTNSTSAPPCFKMWGKTIFILYDVPQLYLSIRNHFYESGEIVVDEVTARWSHLEDMMNIFKTEPHVHEFCYIREEQINLTEESKQDVQLAIATLSHKTAVDLQICKCIHSEARKDNNDMKVYMDSAVVIAQLDSLFNSTYGPMDKYEYQKGYKEWVYKYSYHHKKWAECIQKLKTVRYPKADEELKLRSKRCIDCYIQTLLSLQAIWKYLHINSVKSLSLQRLNQNKLQRLFKLIKKKFRTKQPTSKDFTTALQAVIKQIEQNRNSDCLIA